MATIPAANPPRSASGIPIEQRLRTLESAWKADTQYLSDPKRIIDHPAFRQIVALGSEVVPVLLRDLEMQPSLWVWALAEITGENPILATEAGNIPKMTEAWLKWGRARGMR